MHLETMLIMKYYATLKSISLLPPNAKLTINSFPTTRFCTKQLQLSNCLTFIYRHFRHKLLS